MPLALPAPSTCDELSARHCSQGPAADYVFILLQGTKGEDSARNLGADQTAAAEPPCGGDLL